MTCRYWPLWASLAIMLCPSNAEAHLVTTGLGPIYDGIGHLASSPEVWVPVLALALFAGLRGAAAGRLTLFLLPVAWLVGALVGCRTETAPFTSISAISFLVSGALVAADLRLKRGTVATIAVVLGFCDGCLNGMAIQPTAFRLPGSCRCRRCALRRGGHSGRVCDLAKATVDAGRGPRSWKLDHRNRSTSPWLVGSFWAVMTRDLSVQVKKAAVAERPNQKTTKTSPAIFRLAFQWWLDINSAAGPIGAELVL